MLVFEACLRNIIEIDRFYLLVKGCSLEPNLGIHDYHQKKTQDKLKGRKWLCLNDQLILSDEDGTYKLLF